MIEPQIADAILRGAAVGTFATMGLTLALSPQAGPARWPGVGFFASAIGHTLVQCEVMRGQLGAAEFALWLLSVPGSALFWAFAVTLFADDVRLPPARLLPAAGLLVLGLASRVAIPAVREPIWIVFSLAASLLVLHALFVIWRGWRGDLVERRRRLRAPVMGAAAAYVLVILLADLATLLGVSGPRTPLPQAVVLALLGSAGILMLLRLDSTLFGGSAAMKTAAAPLVGPQAAALERLERAMAEDQVWRREDLTIGGLAAEVGLPEHRLRRLINGALGHRNFAAFVNTRRIEAAKAALVDPAQARTPISAIAYDLGFSSLGPFNRAFKAATGQTPTAWRQASPNPENRAES